MRIEKPSLQYFGESTEQRLDSLERYLYRLASELEATLEPLMDTCERLDNAVKGMKEDNVHMNTAVGALQKAVKELQQAVKELQQVEESEAEGGA